MYISFVRNDNNNLFILIFQLIYNINMYWLLKLNFGALITNQYGKKRNLGFIPEIFF